HEAAHAMGEAVYAYAKAGRLDHARRCRVRAEQLERGIMAKLTAELGEVPGLSVDDAGAGPQVLNVAVPTPAVAEEPEAAEGFEDAEEVEEIEDVEAVEGLDLEPHPKAPIPAQ